MTHIESVVTFDDGVDIVYREKSNTMFLSNPPQPCPDKIWKEQWRIIDGKLQLSKTVKGFHTPAKNIPETIIFDAFQ